MKRILLTTYDGYPNPNQGGPNKIIFELIKNIKGFNLDFLTYPEYIKDIILIDNNKRNISKHKIGRYLYKNINLYKKFTTSEKYLTGHFKKRDDFFNYISNNTRTDILHSHSTFSHFHFRNLKIPKILTIHSKGSYENDAKDEIKNTSFLQKNLEEFKKREISAFNCSDAVVFPGLYSSELFRENYKGKLSGDVKVKIINNGVDIKRIKNIKPDKNFLNIEKIKNKYRLIISNISQFDSHKNIDILIKAIAILKKTYGMNVLLILAGEGILLNKMKELSEKEGIVNDIFFTGKLNNDDIMRLIKISNLVTLLPSKSIFDVITLEAVALNAFILSNAEQGNSEILNDYPNLIKTELNEFNIAENILEYINTPKKPLYYNTDKFTSYQMAENYVKLYNEFL